MQFACSFIKIVVSLIFGIAKIFIWENLNQAMLFWLQGPVI